MGVLRHFEHVFHAEFKYERSSVKLVFLKFWVLFNISYDWLLFMLADWLVFNGTLHSDRYQYHGYREQVIWVATDKQ